MPGTAGREEDEGGAETDALFIKQLREKEGKVSVSPVCAAAVLTASQRQKQPRCPSQMNGNQHGVRPSDRRWFSLKRKPGLTQAATRMH